MLIVLDSLAADYARRLGCTSLRARIALGELAAAMDEARAQHPQESTEQNLARALARCAYRAAGGRGGWMKRLLEPFASKRPNPPASADFLAGAPPTG